MSTSTGIEWTEATWNPIRGCSIVSEGCRNCYAMRQAHRMNHHRGAYEGLTKMTPTGPKWTGKVRTVPELLDLPLRWRKPRRVFVNSMSDLFHEDVPDEFIEQVFVVMARASHHTFQVLTKRPQGMLSLLSDSGTRNVIVNRATAHNVEDFGVGAPNPQPNWPLPNVWLGVSVENQETADERIPALLATPAAVRWLSCEPLLGPLDLTDPLSDGIPTSEQMQGPSSLYFIRHGAPRIDWIVVGGESGPGARPFDLSWARDIVGQCQRASVPVFVKQMGSNPVDPLADTGALVFDREPVRPKFRNKKGGDPEEWPEDLRVREYPASRLAGRQ